MNYRIIIIDDVHQILEDKLTSAGIICDHDPKLDRNMLWERIHMYDGIVVRSKIIIDKELIDKGHKLKLIARVGAGMDGIDTDYATEKDIACLNSPEGNRDALAEHAIGILLALINNICKSNYEVKSGQWFREANRGFELKGKTVGIIGYGYMGQAFAQRLSGFDVNVIAYDKFKTNYGNQYAKQVELEYIYKEADIVSFHIPLNKDNLYLVDDSYINRFEKNIIIMNTARGKILKTDDVVKNMKSGKIIGTALDVIEYEKTDSDFIPEEDFTEDFKYLTQNNNVVLTPHVGGWTVESKFKLASYLADKILNHLIRK